MDFPDDMASAEEWTAALRLNKDLRDAARLLSPQQQRIVVDLYYQIQEARKAAANQLRASGQEPNAWIEFLAGFLQRMEKLSAGGLNIAAREQAVSVWAMAQVGVGPVLAAGLAAYIDITKTPTVSGLWHIAGLDPTAKWEKGQKRPWNSDLKVLRWKIGDSFTKFHNHEDCFYGHVYAARKQLEVQRNQAGLFKDQAAQTLKERQIRKPEVRKVYEAGQLPAGRLELRAQRYAVKLFLSHYFEVAYYEHFGTLPALPHILTVEPERHRHYIPPPGYEMIFAPWRAGQI